MEFYEEGKVELYNLSDDLGEQEDLAAKQPAKRDELQTMLRTWQKQVGAKMPVKR